MRRQRFFTWCVKDPLDERKINYTCHYGDELKEFTSEDLMPHYMLTWLRECAMIDKVELVNNEWYVELSE